MIKKERIAICYATDDRYAQHMSVSIASLLLNAASGHDIDIFILNDGRLSTYHKRRIKCLERLYLGAHIEFMSVDGSMFEHLPLTNLPIATYYRFAVAQLLTDYSVAIYLDCDTIVAGDITNLYSMDLGGKYIAAVPDVFGVEFKRHLDIGSSDFVYCNAGVLLLHLDSIRRDSVDKLFFDNAAKYSDRLPLGDQDVINVTMSQLDGFKYLGYEWNLGHTTKYVTSEMLSSAMDDPQIIHFMGPSKPWHYGCTQHFKACYWDYIKSTEYRGFALEYKIMNPLIGTLKRIWRILYRSHKNSVKQKKTIYVLFLPLYRRRWSGDYVSHYIFGLPIYKRRK